MSNLHPIFEKILEPIAPKEQSPTTHKSSIKIGEYEGAPILACEFNDCIILGSGSDFMGLDKDAFRSLLRFAEKIGWMAD